MGYEAAIEHPRSVGDKKLADHDMARATFDATGQVRRCVPRRCSYDSGTQRTHYEGAGFEPRPIIAVVFTIPGSLCSAQKHLAGASSATL